MRTVFKCKVLYSVRKGLPYFIHARKRYYMKDFYSLGETHWCDPYLRGTHITDPHCRVRIVAVEHGIEDYVVVERVKKS